MKRTLQLTATVSGEVPAALEGGRDLTPDEIDTIAKEAAETALIRCFQRCKNLRVNVTAIVWEGAR